MAMLHQDAYQDCFYLLSVFRFTLALDPVRVDRLRF